MSSVAHSWCESLGRMIRKFLKVLHWKISEDLGHLPSLLYFTRKPLSTSFDKRFFPEWKIRRQFRTARVTLCEVWETPRNPPYQLSGLEFRLRGRWQVRGELQLQPSSAGSAVYNMPQCCLLPVLPTKHTKHTERNCWLVDGFQSQEMAETSEPIACAVS